MEEQSKFKRVYIGTVMTDLYEDKKTIEILPHEVIVNFDGDISDVDVVNKQVTNSNGDVFNIDVSVGNLLTATWYNPNSNRVTAPNVRKGEKVEVYQYGDVDKYYWRTMTNELDLRGLEEVIYAFVNSNDEDVTDIDETNSYTLTISTLNKLIKLMTAANDGELTTHEFFIDTKEGLCMYRDGRGNLVSVDSAEDDLNINLLNDINLTAGQNINSECTELNMEVSGTATISTGDTVFTGNVISFNP